MAAASCGIPDLGITTMGDVLTDLRRTEATDFPVFVDIDTAWGGALNIVRTVKATEKAGAAAVHIEDQVSQKRCGIDRTRPSFRHPKCATGSKRRSMRRPIPT